MRDEISIMYKQTIQNAFIFHFVNGKIFFVSLIMLHLHYIHIILCVNVTQCKCVVRIALIASYRKEPIRISLFISFPLLTPFWCVQFRRDQYYAIFSMVLFNIQHQLYSQHNTLLILMNWFSFWRSDWMRETEGGGKLTLLWKMILFHSL